MCGFFTKTSCITVILRYLFSYSHDCLLYCYYNISIYSALKKEQNRSCTGFDGDVSLYQKLIDRN
jgi:hypothetical protein